MRSVRFIDPAGSVRNGTWTDDHIRFGEETFNHDAVDVVPPCTPSKLVCVGRNYAAHADEFDKEVPDRPLLFLKGPNTLSAHGDTITLPEGKERIDHEAELAVVIGEQCRDVAAADAEGVIEGYTCANDVSNRDDQRREQNWIRGKAFDNSAPIGPVLADPEHVPDDARITLSVNGDVRQDSTIDNLFFSIPELIEEITTYMTLERGDVILTGTPDGVGPLSDGDTVEVTIEGIGTLEHSVRSPR